MENKQDRRVRRTIRALHAAIVALMQIKPIERITVQELCDTADVNRSTFYTHYQNIYDLFEDVEHQTYQTIETLFQGPDAPEMHMYRFLCDIQKNRALFLVLLQRDGLSHFSVMLHTYYGDKWMPQHMRCTKTQQIYLYEFIFTGMLGVVQKWVRSGCEEDPHEISHLIWETFLHIVE